MKRSLRAIAFTVLIALALVPGIFAWRAAGPANLSGPGWAALIAGVFFTAALGGGLMALVFYSDRRGFDDRTGLSTSSTEEPDDRETHSR